MIPDEIVERVREEADIVQIIGEFVRLKRVGTGFRGPCPFHQGTHDNFAVSLKGGYICFVCGEKGDVFTFVEKRLGLDFTEAVKWVGAKAGVEVTEVRRNVEGPDPRAPLYEVGAAAAEFFQRQLREAPHAAVAREYLDSRGISLDAAARFTIGYAPRETGLLREHLTTLGFDDGRQLEAGLLLRREGESEPRPRFRHRLMFPIFDVQGRVVGFGGRVLGEGEPKYLNSAESDIFAKRKLLYGLNWAKQSIRKADRLLVVEGYFDVIRLMLAGIEEVVAPLGTAMTEAQAALIRRYTRNVLLLYDSDLAGQKATFRAGDELLRNGVSVRVITLPEGEDPDTFVAKAGAAGLERAIHDAIDVFDRKVQILQRGGWFSDLRRKREALDKLMPTIRATADLLLRDLYVARTAEVAGISRELLERELHERDEETERHPARAGRPVEEPPEPMDGHPPKALARARARDRRRDFGGGGVRAEHELLRVILHERRFVESVAERIGAEGFEDPIHRRIFTELVSLGPEVGAEELARGLDPEGGEVLQALLAENGGLDRADEIVAGSINALVAREIADRMAEIDRLLPVASEDQKDDLIREKSRLYGEMQALGRSRWKSFGRTRS